MLRPSLLRSSRKGFACEPAAALEVESTARPNRAREELANKSLLRGSSDCLFLNRRQGTSKAWAVPPDLPARWLRCPKCGSTSEMLMWTSPLKDNAVARRHE